VSPCGEVHDRRDPAQHLFDRGRGEARIGDDARALLRILDQGEHSARDEVSRRLVPGDRQEEEERVELRLAELLAVDLGVDEDGHQVVALLTLAGLGELACVHPHFHRRGLAVFERRLELRIVEADEAIRPIEEHVTIFLGHAMISR